MTISGTERDELWGFAREAFGERGADLLMAGLAGADLEAMEERLKLRIELLRTEGKGDIAGLRGEFGELRGEFGELRGEFGELRGEFGELRGEFGELRGEFGELKGWVGQEIGGIRAEIGVLRGEFGELKGLVGQEVGGIRAEIGKQNRLFFFAIFTAAIGVAALVISAFQLGGG